MKKHFSFDITSFGPVKHIIKWKFFPVIFQVLLLFAVIALMLNGLGIGLGETTGQLKILRKTNFTTLVVWGLWWPAMVCVALLFGRIWCTICPLELVNRIGETISRSFRFKRFKLWKWLNGGWAIIGIYLIMQFLVSGIYLHRVPHFTSIMILTGLFYFGILIIWI